MANPQPPPWEEWDRIAAEAMRGHQAPARDTDGGLRGRFVRASIWFALAILPARERWAGWLDRPHAVVQDHDDSAVGVAKILASLPSRP